MTHMGNGSYVVQQQFATISGQQIYRQADGKEPAQYFPHRRAYPGINQMVSVENRIVHQFVQHQKGSLEKCFFCEIAQCAEFTA